MGDLYIFGNGLDLHYNLKTKTDDFKNILKTKSIYSEFDNALDVFCCYNVLWSNFEDDIAYIDLDYIRENHLQYPDYLSDHESDRDGVIFDMQEFLDSMFYALYDSLEEMISNAENDITKLSCDDYWKFSDTDAIVSFNYTSTIETISDVSCVPIIHIHGLYNRDKDLVFGYKEPSKYYNEFKSIGEEDYYVEQQNELINAFYSSLKKSLQVDQLKSFLAKLNSIDSVYVYGHSLGEVDVPYLEMIENIIKPKRWYVSYYPDVKEENKKSIIINSKNLSFKDKITLFAW